MCTDRSWIEAKRLTVEGTEIYVDLNVLFQALDPA